MGINDLKAKAYALAGVTTTQQLKAKYGAIGKLNLRLKASWQQVIDFLQTNPVGDHTLIKTIAELKSEVYALANVSTPHQLKAKYKSLSALNFSFKASWQEALKLLTTRPSSQDFHAWLANPPEEYKDLFAEIETVSAEFGVKLAKAKHLGQESHSLAASLEQDAQEAQEEAEALLNEAKVAYRAAQQAKLN